MTTKSNNLIAAVAEGNVHLVSELLKYKDFDSFDLNQREKDGSTVLMKACRAGDPLMVNVLLKRASLDVNMGTYAEHTPLMAAVLEENEAIVRMLLARPDINVNVQQIDNGDTALMIAVQSGNSNLVQLLLGCPGIDVTMKNFEGQSAFELAPDVTIRNVLSLHFNSTIASTAPPPSTWLALRMEGSGYDIATIRECEQRLVVKEGFLNEADFAECLPDVEINRSYLAGIGIFGMGLRNYLVKLHAQLHGELRKRKRA